MASAVFSGSQNSGGETPGTYWLEYVKKHKYPLNSETIFKHMKMNDNNLPEIKAVHEKLAQLKECLSNVQSWCKKNGTHAIVDIKEPIIGTEKTTTVRGCATCRSEVARIQSEMTDAQNKVYRLETPYAIARAVLHLTNE